MESKSQGTDATYSISLEKRKSDVSIELQNQDDVDVVLANKNLDADLVLSNKNLDADLEISEISTLHNDITSADMMYINPDLNSNNRPNEQYRLSWHNLCVDAELPPPSCFSRFKARITGNNEVPDAKPIKPIIRGVSGAAEPGSLLAIMGASGAGKTTLLNVLSRQNVARLRLSGSILVNNQNIKNKIKTVSAYVQQEDLFIGTLTVKEHLTFQALLRMDDSHSREQKKQRVMDVIQQLGLTKCKDTIIGVPGRIRGISGGENKRLSFASEIITNPKLLFVDEPTSGLDSFMAENVIMALQKIASEGRTVLATIHQPSSEVFQLFDRLLLMSEGRTAFLGTTLEAIDFFQSAGHPCPQNYNPADHYVHTLAIIPGQEEECKEKAMAICDKYEQEHKKEISDSRNDRDSNDVYAKISYKVGYFSQLRAVLWRSAKANQREPFVSSLRLIQALAIALIAGLVYLQQDNDQDGVVNINGAIFFVIITMSFNSITGALFVFPAELPVFLKEHKLGMYRTDIYFWSKTLSELPWYILSAFVFSTIVYFMTGLPNDAKIFFIFTAINQLVTQCALSYGYFISAACPSVQVATTIGPPLMMPFLLFGGFFIKDKSIPVYFIWLKYLSWFKYAFEALQINQWEDFGKIDCDRNNTSACFIDGKDVIDKNGYDVDNFGFDIGLMFALLIGFRVLAFLLVLLKSSRAK